MLARDKSDAIGQYVLECNSSVTMEGAKNTILQTACIRKRDLRGGPTLAIYIRIICTGDGDFHPQLTACGCGMLVASSSGLCSLPYLLAVCLLSRSCVSSLYLPAGLVASNNVACEVIQQYTETYVGV